MKDYHESEMRLDRIKKKTGKSLVYSIVVTVILLVFLTWATVRIFSAPMFDKDDTYKAVFLLISVYYCVIYLLLSQLIPHSFYSVIYAVDLFIAKIGVFFTGFHIDETDNYHDIWYNVRRVIKLLYAVVITAILFFASWQ